jgi:predicted component of type VI protein secretion system
MKQAAKATALVLAVSLLSGCSSSPKLADKPLAKTECEIVPKLSWGFLKSL